MYSRNTDPVQVQFLQVSALSTAPTRGHSLKLVKHIDVVWLSENVRLHIFLIKQLSHKLTTYIGI